MSAALQEDMFAIFKEAQGRALSEPEWFYAEILRCDPLTKWQLKGLQAVLDVYRHTYNIPTVVNHEGLNSISAVSGHGTGKTQWLAQISHIWSFVFPSLAVITAPKQDQIRTRFFPRYRLLLRNTIPEYKQYISVDVLKACFYGNPDWGIQGETASDPDNIAGYHDTPQLILVDEASGQRLDAMYQTVEGALTTPGSAIVEIGNPTRSSGEFWSHHNKERVMQNYFLMHINFNDIKDEKFYDGKYERNMRRKYGKDSIIYKIRVLGEFVTAEKFQLVHYDWLATARDKEWAEDGSFPRLVVSVDVADGGTDFSIVTATLFYDSFTLVLKQRKFSFEPSIASIESAKVGIEMFNEFNGHKNGEQGDTIVIDSLGVGAGTAGYTIEQGYPTVRFKGGAKSVDMEEWRNQRVQCHIAMRNDYRDGKVVVHPEAFEEEEDWDEFCEQMTSLRQRPGGERNEDLETKEQHIKRTQKSPDRSDSGMMAYTGDTPYEAVDNSVPALFGTSIAGGYDGGLT